MTPAWAGGVLEVELVDGEVQIDHIGETRVAQPGDPLHERDVIRVADGAHLSMRFAEGVVELGPGAAFAIERLPASDEAADLRSIFSLWKGYLHLIWVRPPPTKRWPLFVYFGGKRASLVEGEYFFDRAGERTRSCVAAGRLTVSSIVGDGLETHRPSACYEVATSGAPRIQGRSPDGWAAVRAQFSLDPSATAPSVATLAARTSETFYSLTGPTTVEAPPAQATFVSAPASAAATALVATSAALPATAAAPPVDASIAAGTPGNWVVIVGSFADAANADALQQKLIASGYTPFVRTKLLDGKAWNSVQIRGNPTREAAQAKLDAMAAKFGLSNMRIVQMQ